MHCRPLISTLFPYTTLFRSDPGQVLEGERVEDDDLVEPVEELGLERGPHDRHDLVASGLRRRSEEHTSELQSRRDLVCRLLLEKKKNSGQVSQLLVLHLIS